MNLLQEVWYFHQQDIVKMMLEKIFFKKVCMVFLTSVIIIFLANNINAICCEQTLDEGICLNVGDRGYCNEDYRIDDTACESTQYCSTGTCVNNVEGICISSSSAACDPSLGGYWYDDAQENLPECQVGCCLIGEGAAFVPRTTCNKMAADIAIQPDFRETITTQEACLLSAGPTRKGACVFQTGRGRECTIETREKCNSEDKEFHAGLLCSAPELGTICTMTERTTCVDGVNEVYFVDNCENPANVYDSTMVGNIDYWTYMKDPASDQICGYGNANTNSEDCGNCNYIGGSTCSSSRGAGVNPTYGDYFCRDLSCTYNGETKPHGSAWCSQPISEFENAKPGDLSYRLYCYNGEVQWELCGNLREKLCKEDEEIFGEANCLPNRWQDCVFQNSSKDCLNTDKRDCRVEEGISRKNESGGDLLFLHESGVYIKATCVSNYPPAFNFWEPDAGILGITPRINPAQVCSAGSVSSVAGYHKSILTDWLAKEGTCFGKCIEECETKILFKPECQQSCFDDCPGSESFMNMEKSGGLGVGNVDLNTNWAKNQEGLCISLGDCGVKSNYIDQDSYYSWKELFIGDNVTKSSIPEADSYQ